MPQSGIVFVAGASGSVRVGDPRPTPFHAAGYDRDLSSCSSKCRGCHVFPAVSRTGEVVDSGKIVKRPTGD